MATGVQRDVVVNVLKTTASLTRPGFGMMMIAGYHTKFVNRVREYGSLTELADAGFAPTDPIYRAVATALAQQNRVRSFKVGRLTAATQVVQIGIGSAVANAKYTVTINGTPYEYAADGTPTIQEIVEGLSGLILADGPQPVTSSEDNVTLTLTADVPGATFTVSVSDSTGLNVMTVKDATADRGIQAQLNALIAEDDAWYGLIMADANGAAELAQVAAWVEPQKRLCLAISQDTGCIDPVVTNDIMSTLKAANYERTTVVYHPTPSAYLNAGVMSRQFSQPPGSSNPAHKVIVGVLPTKLKEAQMSAIENKNGNHYVEAGGAGRFRYGRMPNGEWFNTVHGTDWLESEATYDVYAAIASNEVLTFEQSTAQMLGTILEGTLAKGVRAKLLASDPPPFATVPDVLDEVVVTEQNRADRILPGVEAQARYAGAVNKVTITLRLGV